MQSIKSLSDTLKIQETSIVSFDVNDDNKIQIYVIKSIHQSIYQSNKTRPDETRRDDANH